MKTAKFVALMMVLTLILTAFAVPALGEEENIWARNKDSALEPPAPDPVTGDKIRIGLSMPVRGEFVWECYRQGVLDGAKSLGNVEILEQSAQNNANDQLQHIENFIAQQVNGILGSAVDDKAILQAIKKCNEAEIPFIEFGRIVNEGDGAKIQYTVSVEVYDMIKDQALWLVDYATANNTKLKVIELMGALNDTYATLQRDILQEVAAENPDKIEIVQQIPGDWNAEKGLAGIQNALKAHPDVDAIFAHSEFYHAGMKSALTQAGKWVPTGDPNHVIYISSGASLPSLDDIKAGYIDVFGFFSPYDCGFNAALGIVALAQGKELVGTNYKVPGTVVDQANYDEKSPPIYAAIEPLTK